MSIASRRCRVRRCALLAALLAFASVPSLRAEVAGDRDHATHDRQHGMSHRHRDEGQGSDARDSRREDANADDTNQTPPEKTADHVPPPPPAHAMDEMNAEAMATVMAMDDNATLAMLKFDRLEHASGDGDAIAWKLSAWAGGDFDRVLVRSEGEHANGGIERADAELLWNHAIAAFWDADLGIRQDFGRGANRRWAAFGVSGLAPYGIEIGATGYLGHAGRTALRLELDYEVLLTQRLVLQPRFELNAYGRDDPAAHTGSGLSDAAFGLRLRYEIRREFAPYVGVEWSRRFGRSTEGPPDREDERGDVEIVVGVRFWY
jgi:copper resistance protein B